MSNAGKKTETRTAISSSATWRGAWRTWQMFYFYTQAVHMALIQKAGESVLKGDFFFQLLSNEWHWRPISMLSLCCAAAGVSSPVGTSPALITIHSNKFHLNVTRWILIKDDLRVIFRWNFQQNLFAAPRQSFMSVDVTVVCFVSWRRESIWDPRSSFLVANAWRRLLASIGRVARPTGN